MSAEGNKLFIRSTRIKSDSLHKNRTCHGWSGCNEIRVAFVYVHTRTFLPEARHIPWHLLQPWYSWVLFSKGSHYFWDSVETEGNSEAQNLFSVYLNERNFIQLNCLPPIKR